MTTVSVRSIVDDVEAALAFYTGISTSTWSYPRHRPSPSSPGATSASS